MADLNLKELTLSDRLSGTPVSSTSSRDMSAFRLNNYAKLDDVRPSGHERKESASPEKKGKVLQSQKEQKEIEITTVSEGLNLALSHLEGGHNKGGSLDFRVTHVPDGDASCSPPKQRRDVLSPRRVASRRNPDRPGRAASRFQKLVFMIAHEMGHSLRMERIFHVSDHEESICLIVQLILILISFTIATATADYAWRRSLDPSGMGSAFIQDDVTLGLQITTSCLTFLSLCVWYREHRIILHLTSVKIHGWFSFPDPLVSAFQVLMLGLHGPPGVNPIWCTLTFFRCMFIFRIFKFHPAVQGIRDSQLAAGLIPSFSPLFYFKTVIRVKPLLAMASILVVCLTPVSIAYTFTERYGWANNLVPDDAVDTDFIGVAWEMIYFAVTQQPPVPTKPSRILCILASFVASALFTFIFTGMLSALELDAGHSAALKKAFERNLRKNHRDAAAAMIQSHYRAAKQRNPKTEVAASVARQRFKTLSMDLQNYLAEKEGGINLTSLIYDVNDNCLQNMSLVQKLTGIVEQKSEDLTKLENEHHTEIMAKLLSHTETIKEATVEQAKSIMETENKALASITAHFEATQALVMESAGQITASAAGRPVGERLVMPKAPDPEQLRQLFKAQEEAFTQLRQENTELHLANQQGMATVIATQEQTLGQQAELLSKLQTRQEAQEQALNALQTKEEERFNAIMQAIGALAASQAAARVAGGAALSPESLQQLLAAQAPSSADPQVLQKLQVCQDEQKAQKQALGEIASTQARMMSILEKQQLQLKALAPSSVAAPSADPQVLLQLQEVQAAQKQTLTDVAATQERIVSLLEKQQLEMKANQDHTHTLDERVQSLLTAQTQQGISIEKLQITQEAAQASNEVAFQALQTEVRGSNDQLYSEVQNVLAALDSQSNIPVLAFSPVAAEKPKEEPKEEPKPKVDQYAEVYIPEAQRVYPQYVHDVAAQVEEKKVKAIFSAFALYDLFPIIDRDRSGHLQSSEVRRITFDQAIHAAYATRERKPWPTEQMNKLQAAITKLFKGRKIEMDQKIFVTMLAFVTQGQQ